jgi:cytoskeletal protein RodZ
VKRLEQKFNKPIVVLIVGVVAAALNILLYFGYEMSGTPLIGHMYSSGASLPGVISKSESKGRSDPEPVIKAEAKTDDKSGYQESLEADPASFSSPSPVSAPPQASASAQSSASPQVSASAQASVSAQASAQASPSPAPPPQQQSVTHSSSEVSISQDERTGGSSSIDPSSSCPFSEKGLKVPGSGCAHATVPVP